MTTKYVGLTKDDVYHVLTEFYQNVLLKRFVVKEDLEGLATKDDVAEIKDDISKMDRKLDLVAEKVTDLEFDYEKRLVRVEKALAVG